MNTGEKRVPMKRAVLESPPTHNRSITRSAALAWALVALIAVSVLPGYSWSRRTPLAVNTAQTTPQSEGFKVARTLDTEHAVTQIIRVGGGTVTATGADGATFTLIVPMNALLSAARVTMTPVTALGDLPLSGGLAAAVQLEPDGLGLVNFATLVIEPPQSLSPGLETSFAWDQAGDDFHLFSMLPPSGIQRENTKGSGPPLNPRGLIFKLLHFSGYGVGSGTDADRDAQQQRQPSGSEARFEQRLEAVIGRERRRQLATAPIGIQPDSVEPAADEEDPAYLDSVIQVVQDEYNNVVKPAMDAALLSRDDKELECAFQKALGCNRKIELVIPADLSGKKGKFFKKAKKAIFAFLEKALATMGENSAQRCSKDHKPEESILLLSIASRQQKLGFDNSKTVDSAVRCAHFELEFDSETELRDPAATVMTQVHATVPLHISFDSPLAETTGEAPLEYFSCQWTPTDPDCSATTTTSGSRFRVISFNIDLNPRTVGNCNATATEGKLNIVSVDIDPGLPSESITVKCKLSDGTTETTTVFQVIWSATFGEFHSDEELGGAGALSISGWDAGNGSLLARKNYSRNGSFDGQYPMTERTTINLWHRPE